MSTNQERVHALFSIVRYLAVEDRKAYLDKECVDDAELREEVESLLKYAPTSAPTRETGTIALGEKDVVDHRYEAGNRIGEYEIKSELGEGGFGIVYFAKQHEPVEREVAIKVLHSNRCTDTFILGFEAERQTLANMSHPGIAHFYDAGLTEHNQPFFVMEFVSGQPITEYCNEHRLSIKQRLALFADVCKAVQHAHTKGVIHRDLTPNNILVSTSEDGSPRAQIIDFGISRKTDEETADVMGTLMYMSPEQATKDASVDTRSDIYTLGVVLYELLVGKPPLDREMFKDAALQAQLKLVKEQDSPTPSTKLSGIGDSDETAAIAEQRQENLVSLLKILRRELDWIPRKALQKDPERRYATASEFGEDISRYLNDEVVVAVPDSTGYRFKKSLKRHKGAFSGVVVVVLILVVSVFYVSLQWRETEKQRVNAENSNVETQAQKYYKNVMGAASAVPLDIVTLKKQFLENAWVAYGSPPKDEMPFEWKYLSQSYDGSTKTWEGADITGVTVFDADDRFAMASKESIRIIDRTSGEEVCVIPRNEYGIFKITPDGSRVLLFNYDKTVQTVEIWNVEKGELEHTIKIDGKWSNGPSHRMFSKIEVCNDQVFAVLDRRKVFVIDIHEGRIINAIEPKFAQLPIHRCNDVEFSHDKETLAVASTKGIELFHVKSGDLLLEIPGERPLTEDELEKRNEEGNPPWGSGYFLGADGVTWIHEIFHAADIKKLVFSKNDSELIGVNYRSKDIGRWDVETGKLLHYEDIVGELTPHASGPRRGSISSPVFSKDRSMLAFSVQGESFVRVWDIDRKQKFDIDSGSNYSFSPDGSRFAIRHDPLRISIYDVKNKALIETYQGHLSDINSISFAAMDGSSLLSSDKDNVFLWTRDLQKLSLPMEAGDSYMSGNLAVSPDDKVLATWCNAFTKGGFPDYKNSLIQLYDLESREPICALSTPPLDLYRADTELLFSPDGRFLVSHSWCSVQVYDVRTATMRYDCDPENARYHLSPLAFSDDGTRLFLVQNLSEIHVIDTNSWKELDSWDISLESKTEGTKIISSLVLNQDGKRLAGFINGEVFVFDIENGKKLETLLKSDQDETLGLQNTKKVSMMFSPDGKRLIASVDNIIHQWDTTSFELVKSLNTGHHVDLLSVDSEYKTTGITKLKDSSGSMVSAYWTESAEHEVMTLNPRVFGMLTFTKNEEMLIGVASSTVHIFDTKSRGSIKERQSIALDRYARLQPVVDEFFEKAIGDATLASRMFENDLGSWDTDERAAIRILILKNSVIQNKEVTVKELRQVLNRCKEVLGEEDTYTREKALDLGKKLYDQKEYNEAEAVFQEWREISKNALGEDNAATLALGKWLGKSLDAQKKYSEAEAVFKELFEISKNTLGEDDPTTIDFANWMAYPLYMQENYVEAEEVYRKWLEIGKNALGETHHTTLSLAKYYGRSLFEQEKYVEAEAVFQEWSNISRNAKLYFEINITLDLAKGHGQSLYKQEKYDKAEAVYGKWLEICRGIGFAKRSGPMPIANPWWEDNEHKNQAKDKAISFSFLFGDSMCQQEKYIEAEAVYREWLKISKNEFGEDNSNTISLANWMAYSLFMQEKYGDAEEVYRKWLEISKKAIGEAHRTTCSLADYYGRSLYNQEKYGEAEAVFRKLLEISIRSLGEDSKSTIEISQWLAPAVYQQENYREAEQLFLKWYEISKKTFGEGNATTTRFEWWLAKTSDVLEKPEEAQKYRDMMPEGELQKYRDKYEEQKIGDPE